MKLNQINVRSFFWRSGSTCVANFDGAELHFKVLGEPHPDLVRRLFSTQALIRSKSDDESQRRLYFSSSAEFRDVF
ncbi:MAG TPA: hypothetical protein VGI85_08030 [Chthoniobacterales bacterium]|jgi:hypothetical protein